MGKKYKFRHTMRMTRIVEFEITADSESEAIDISNKTQFDQNGEAVMIPDPDMRVTENGLDMNGYHSSPPTEIR